MVDRFRLKAALWGLIAAVLLAVLVVLGSRNLQHFDAALVGYTFATLFAAFGIVYRYAMWLQRPPTRLYWRRGWQLTIERCIRYPERHRRPRPPRTGGGVLHHRGRDQRARQPGSRHRGRVDDCCRPVGDWRPTLAGATLIAAAPSSPLLTDILPFLKGFTLLF